MSASDVTPAAGKVDVAHTPEEAGRRAGSVAARILRAALLERGSARVVFASAPSQDAMIRSLAGSEGIDWSRVTSMHLDEYRGIDPRHQAAFGQWLADRLPNQALAGLDRIRTDGHASAEIDRYSQLLTEPIDLVCLGIGVNGHLAFNEPGDTDFSDPSAMREVELTHTSRMQQVDEGLFDNLNQVPTHALTMTVSAILRGRAMVGTVLGKPKAASVAAAFTGPVTTDLPASALRTHEEVYMFLDEGAASGLPQSFVARRDRTN